MEAACVTGPTERADFFGKRSKGGARRDKWKGGRRMGGREPVEKTPDGWPIF